MLVYFDRDQHATAQGMGRYHPWTVTTHTPDGRYYDFKADPDAIGSGLEDLGHVRGTPLEQAIVEFIAWANGPDCPFETNDFGLRPLKPSESTVSPKALEQILRVTILFRDLERNRRSGDLVPFAGRMEHALRAIDPNFRDACWGWALWPHLFLALGDEHDPNAEGHVIQYMCWAWGDTREEVHSNMAEALANLRSALEQEGAKAAA
jgi:hypothetical protein